MVEPSIFSSHTEAYNIIFIAYGAKTGKIFSFFFSKHEAPRNHVCWFYEQIKNDISRLEIKTDEVYSIVADKVNGYIFRTSKNLLPTSMGGGGLPVGEGVNS